MIHYDHLINAEIISALSIHLTLLELEIGFTNFVWNLSYSMICLDLLTTVSYCNCMTWYQVISAWVINQNRFFRSRTNPHLKLLKCRISNLRPHDHYCTAVLFSYISVAYIVTWIHKLIYAHIFMFLYVLGTYKVAGLCFTPAYDSGSEAGSRWAGPVPQGAV